MLRCELLGRGDWEIVAHDFRRMKVMAIRLMTVQSASELDRVTWNHLARDASPMMEWEYFLALENSGVVSAATGYHPCHLVAYLDGEPVALAPLYSRDRAWVEFGDGGLLEFLTRVTGVSFNQGFVGSTPFTPVPGYRWLCRFDLDREMVFSVLLEEIERLCESRGLLSCRFYFVSPDVPEFHALLRKRGYLSFATDYSLWQNQRYGDFEDYLKSLKSSKRTKIRRELREIRQQRINLQFVAGDDVPAEFYRDIHQLYRRTWFKHMGNGMPPFLNEAFFTLLGEYFGHRSKFCVAVRDSERLAMALFYEKAQCLYGRYWGSFQDLPFLHFATCYYHPIQYAIQKEITLVDPGFGGDHKLLRGFTNTSAIHFVKFFGEQPRRLALSVLRAMHDRRDSVRGNTE
jgi:uncharacterized protein